MPGFRKSGHIWYVGIDDLFTRGIVTCNLTNTCYMSVQNGGRRPLFIGFGSKLKIECVHEVTA